MFKAAPAPINIIDYQVMCHHIEGLAVGVRESLDSSANSANVYGGDVYGDPTYQTWIKLSWALILNRSPLCMPLDHNWTVAIVDDTKPYWRSEYLAARGFPAYKGNRDRSEEKKRSLRGISALGLEYIQQPEAPYYYFADPGFEADDFAGMICQIHQESNSYRMLYLSTCDTDWHQLVSDRVWFANTFHYVPRLRGIDEVIAHASKSKALKRAVIEHPREIAQVKQLVGDTADNLPAGSPLEVIDLWNPPEAHRPGIAQRSKAAMLLANGRPNCQPEHYEIARSWIISQGLPLAA